VLPPPPATRRGTPAPESKPALASEAVTEAAARQQEFDVHLDSSGFATYWGALRTTFNGLVLTIRVADRDEVDRRARTRLPAHVRGRRLSPGRGGIAVGFDHTAPSIDERIERSAPVGARAATVRRSPLRVGAVDDPAERAADAIASRVVQELATSDDAGAPPGWATRIRRMATEPVVGPEGGDVDERTAASIRAAGAEGRALPHLLRSAMEASFGRDLSEVRVHAGAAAATANDRLGAQAFTVGRHIYFRDGLPDVASPGGQHLLAHEVAHTVQQGAGRIRRKVGIEFETALPTSRWIDGEDDAAPAEGVKQEFAIQLRADRQDEKYKHRERVRGHEKLVDKRTTEGWFATVDNTSRIGSAAKANIEVVTSPAIAVGRDWTSAELQLRTVIANIKTWLDGVMGQNPDQARVRVGDANTYVIGFPSDAQIARLEVPKELANFNRGLVKTDAYAQVNLGVGMDRVAELVGAAAEAQHVAALREKRMEPAQAAAFPGNVAQYEESAGLKSGVKIGKEIAAVLSKSIKVDERHIASLIGLATLISVAVYSAKTSQPNTLLKKYTTVMPKSGLAAWWKLHLDALEPPPRAVTVATPTTGDTPTVAPLETTVPTIETKSEKADVLDPIVPIETLSAAAEEVEKVALIEPIESSSTKAEKAEAIEPIEPVEVKSGNAEKSEKSRKADTVDVPTRKKKVNKREVRKGLKEERRGGGKQPAQALSARPFHDALQQNMKEVMRCFALELKAGKCPFPMLMFPERKEQLAEVEELKDLSGVTVEQYVAGILSMKADPLTSAALKHRQATGGGTSEVPAEDVAGDVGPTEPARPVGVVELRNISEYWKYADWADKAVAYAKLASEMAFGR
jgi:hypothetical protein